MVTARSAAPATVVVSVAVLFGPPGSPVLLVTEAEFTVVAAALGPTATVSSKVEDVPAANRADRVQVTVWPAAVQVQVALLELEAKLRPVGSVSVTVIGPAAE